MFFSEKAMAPHSGTLAWKIPWTEEPSRLQSMGSRRVGHDWVTSLSLSCIGEENGNPLQCSCLGIPGMGEPDGLPSMGSHRVGHNWSNLAAVAADIFLDLSCFFDDPMDIGNLIYSSSAFSKSSLNIWTFWFMYCWNLGGRILSITLLVCEMSAIVQ